jgi:hypothetical protein
LKDKSSFKIILILLALLTFSGCGGEGGNALNEILAKTVKFFSPKKSDLGVEKTGVFNIITSAEEDKKGAGEKNQGDMDTTMLDSLEEIGKALNWVKAFYTDRGNPDPFAPLITTGSESEEKLINVDLAELSGIVWVKDKYLAIVKEGNRGYVLRENDLVVGGKVMNITESSITFLLRKFGEETKITLSLKKQER